MNLVPLDIQYYLMIICSCLSLAGSLFILFTSVLKSQHFVFYTKIVLFIAISDIIRSALFMVPCNKLSSPLIINLIAIVVDSTFLITILWSTYISIALYLVVVKSRVDFDKNYKYWFFVSFFLIPLVQMFPSFTDSHKASGTLCTISDDSIGDIWRYSVMYVPAWILILTSALACFSIYLQIQNIVLDEIQELLVKKLIFYPVVLIAEFLPATICSVLTSFDVLDDNSIPGVISLNIIALHGASNSIIYAINLQKVREEREKMIHAMNIISAKIDSKDFDTENLLFGTFSIGTSETSKSGK